MAPLDRGTAADLDISTSVDPQGVAVITLVGDMDLSNADRLSDAVSAVAERHPQRLLFDLAGLRFIDSAGIAVLVAAAKELGDVRVRDASPIVSRVIELTGLTDVLPTELR
jgi:anti-sigma B factor antagonist